MGRKIQLIEDRVGTVYYDLPDGVPLTATVTIRDASGGTLSPDVTDAAATTTPARIAILTGWSSSAPRTLPVTIFGDVTVRRHYLLRRENGEEEFVRVVAQRADEIDIADRVSFEPASGDRLYDTRTSYALTTAQTADRGLNYRAQWTITDTYSTVHVVESLYDVVRAVPKRHATAAGLRQYVPELANQWEQLGGVYHGWEDRLAAAFDRILDDLEGHGDWSGAIVDWGQAESPTYERLLLTMADGGFIPAGDHWPGDTWVERCNTRYRTALEAWLRRIRWYDENDDRTATEGEESANRASLVLRY